MAKTKRYEKEICSERGASHKQVRSEDPPKYRSGIKSWPKNDRLRKKMLKDGEHTLSNSELLPILLRIGRRSK